MILFDIKVAPLKSDIQHRKVDRSSVWGSSSKIVPKDEKLSLLEIQSQEMKRQKESEHAKSVQVSKIEQIEKENEISVLGNVALVKGVEVKTEIDKTKNKGLRSGDVLREIAKNKVVEKKKTEEVTIEEKKVTVIAYL